MYILVDSSKFYRVHPWRFFFNIWSQHYEQVKFLEIGYIPNFYDFHLHMLSGWNSKKLGIQKIEMYNLVLHKYLNWIMEVIVFGYICCNQIVWILQCYQICIQSVGITLSCPAQVENIEIGYIVMSCRIILWNSQKLGIN